MAVEMQNLNMYEKAMTVIFVVYAFCVNLSTSMVSICISLGTIVMLVQYCKTGAMPHVNKNIIIAVMVYAATGMIANIINVGMLDGIKMWIGHTYRFLPMLWAIMYIKTANQIKYVILAFLGTVFAENIAAINQSLHIWGNYIENGGRVRGLTSNPNVLAPMLLMFIITLYTQINALAIKPKTKITMLAGICLSLVSLLLTMSRGSWLTFIIILVLGIFMLRHKAKQLVICLALLLICMSMLFVAKPQYYQRMETVTDMNMSSNVARTYIWRDTWAMISEHPIAGVGLEKYSDIFNNEYASKELLEIEKRGVQHSHNNILMVLAEGGIISLAGYMYFYIAMLIMLFRKAIKAKWQSWYAVMGILLIVSIQLTGMVDMNVYNAHIMRLFLFLLGMSFAGCMVVDKY